MFKRNRYLILATTIGLLSVALLMLLYRHVTLSALVDHETRSNAALTEVFSNSVWPSYRHLFVANGARGDAGQGAGKAIDDLHAEVRQLMTGSNVVKVKIYNLAGLTVYSSDPSEIGQYKTENEGFISASKGEAVSAITFREEFDAFEGRRSDINVVSSYIPIVDATSRLPEAVFEIYSDVTRLIGQLQRLQWQIVPGVLGCVALIYGLLLRVARRADLSEAKREEEAQRNEERLRYLAYHDPLTGLPNRPSFQENVERAVKHAERQNSAVAVMYLDVDRFKLVNDSFGHDAGDELLKQITARIRQCVRKDDTVFRTGGDEFTILVEDLSSPDAAMNLANRILDGLQEPFLINGQSIVSTVSIGISIFPDDDVESAQLIKDADAAMYLAKDEGRNRFRFYTPELNEHALERLALESGLQQALVRNEFVLYYQPRLAPDGTTVLGFEALLRWQRDDGGLVLPDEFIPVLEQTGLITQVGEWVLREACSQAKRWLKAGHRPMRISVNVSPRQFRDSDFPDKVKAALSEAELDPRLLELELTESALIDNPPEAIAIMEELKALGVTLSFDDFGTGYSSFGYLKHLPVDYLKIDRSFVCDIDDSSKDVAIVAAIAGVAHGLGIRLVAEGVERVTQVDLLVAQGCQELQGFLYSKPVPPEIAERWLIAERRGNVVEVPGARSART